METKEELVIHIKEWIALEDELKTLQKEIKIRRLKKKELNNQLINVMNANDIDCFNINNGRLVHAKTKIQRNDYQEIFIKSLGHVY